MPRLVSQSERLRRLPRNEFERMAAVEFPNLTGMARRLVDGALNSDEQAIYDRTVQVLEMRRAGVPQAEQAARLGLKISGFSSLCQRASFRLVARWLREREIATDDETRVDGLKGERSRFDRMGALSLDYIESCFAKDPKTGEYLAPKRAEWAANLVAKGKGWDEPERQLGIIGELKIELVMAKGADIRASDVLRAQARLATIDVTPVQTPAAGVKELFSDDGDEDESDDEYDGPEFLPERAPPAAPSEPLAAPDPEGDEGNES